MFGKELPGFGFVVVAKDGSAAPLMHACVGGGPCTALRAPPQPMTDARRGQLRAAFRGLTEPRA